ncbi:monovalent cation:H+ antiporter, CPA1 (nhx1) [Stylosanthes scabra]|uniref:Monovalent cation:H+ antiporter, CPA1 (Nhx1) n=1 Tax=Stylosanthes scabra TaxID=79078 RepID=A0ABU6W6G2_9FABA|nr:monovalent cation:H+ antiporter, CPA1 (nhx1) [Stylosanthes scabra]
MGRRRGASGRETGAKITHIEAICTPRLDISLTCPNFTDGKSSKEGISFRQQVIIWWAGLMRGAVSVALAYNQLRKVPIGMNDRVASSSKEHRFISDAYSPPHKRTLNYKKVSHLRIGNGGIGITQKSDLLAK